MNIYLLSQHNIGIGHMNRTALLAGELGKLSGIRVLHLSCGPSTGIITPARNVALIELPPLVVKDLSTPDLVSIERGKTKEDVERERVEIITGLFQRICPDIFITEFFPFSPQRLDGTVIPLLEIIKRRYPKCRAICSVRDIPICHGEKLISQKVRYISSLLSTYYNLVLIHSDSSVMKVDDIRGYRALKCACPMVYTGYIARPSCPTLTVCHRTGPTRILVTVGGGRDGQRIIDSTLRVARLKEDYLFDIVCGPLMEGKSVDRITARSQRLKNVRVFPYLRELKKAVSQYDLLICSAGYNTVLEAVTNQKRCISIPRKSSYEQRKRVSLFSKRKLLWSVADSRLTSKGLVELMEKALGSSVMPRLPLNTDGLRNSTSAIRDLFMVE